MKYFTMRREDPETMSFTTFLNDASGRVMLFTSGLFFVAGGIGATLSPSLIAYPVLAATPSLAAAVGAIGWIRAIYVAPPWALASILAVSYPLPLFYFFEVMSIKNRWPTEYVLFPLAAILFCFSATGTRPLKLRPHRESPVDKSAASAA